MIRKILEKKECQNSIFETRLELGSPNSLSNFLTLFNGFIGCFLKRGYPVFRDFASHLGTYGIDNTPFQRLLREFQLNIR